jgi:hypothetical protein
MLSDPLNQTLKIIRIGNADGIDASAIGARWIKEPDSRRLGMCPVVQRHVEIGKPSQRD